MTTKVHSGTREICNTKIKKSDGPSPTTYDLDNCYAKTQFTNRVAEFSKKKNRNFVDIYKKTKEFLPGVGTY